MTIIYLFTYAHRSPSVFLILIVSCFLTHSHPFTLPTVLTGHQPVLFAVVFPTAHAFCLPFRVHAGMAYVICPHSITTLAQRHFLHYNSCPMSLFKSLRLRYPRTYCAFCRPLPLHTRVWLAGFMTNTHALYNLLQQPKTPSERLDGVVCPLPMTVSAMRSPDRPGGRRPCGESPPMTKIRGQRPI